MPKFADIKGESLIDIEKKVSILVMVNFEKKNTCIVSDTVKVKVKSSLHLTSLGKWERVVRLQKL